MYPALQLLHAGAPTTLKVPGGHIAAAGVGDVDAGGHAYPALQLVHTLEPATLNVPARHAATVALGAPDTGHA
jgi:hypothetical protein